jgi:hypothetical protein
LLGIPSSDLVNGRDEIMPGRRFNEQVKVA